MTSALVTKQEIKQDKLCAPAKPKSITISEILAGKKSSSPHHFHWAAEVQGEGRRRQEGGEHHKADVSLQHPTGSREEIQAALERTRTESLNGGDWY